MCFPRCFRAFRKDTFGLTLSDPVGKILSDVPLKHDIKSTVV